MTPNEEPTTEAGRRNPTTRHRIANARQRWLRFRRWWAAFRHVPHPRAAWCGDPLCPYAIESIR